MIRQKSALFGCDWQVEGGKLLCGSSRLIEKAHARRIGNDYNRPSRRPLAGTRRIGASWKESPMVAETTRRLWPKIHLMVLPPLLAAIRYLAIQWEKFRRRPTAARHWQVPEP